MAQELKAQNVVATIDVNPEVVDNLGCTEYAAYDADEVDAVLAEKDAEIRRLNRALWISRANSAEGQFFYWCSRLGVESGFTKADIRGYSVNTKRRLRTIGEWINTWKDVERKCRSKAEEYR